MALDIFPDDDDRPVVPTTVRLPAPVHDKMCLLADYYGRSKTAVITALVIAAFDTLSPQDKEKALAKSTR